MSSRATIDRFLDAYADGRYFSALVNAPSPHGLRQPPELVYHATLHTVEPHFTIVTPVFNCAASLHGYIEATASAASLPFDWILIDDGSGDGTAERATALLRASASPLVAHATIVRNPAPIFETASDNIGFWLADTDVIIEVQSDIYVREAAFDALVLRTLAMTPRPSAVSGRCGHSFFELRHSLVRALLGGRREACVGLCGDLIETPAVVEPIRGHVYRCETVPRGPWAVRKSDLERAGYLDERYFFQDNDDHDYHRRLFDATGRRPVYAPMSIDAPLARGANRQPRTGLNRTVFEMLTREKTRRRGSPAFRRFLAAQWRPAKPERIV
jgi:glycosyl transferase family 2